MAPPVELRVRRGVPRITGASLYEVWRQTNGVVAEAQRLATVGATTRFTDLTARPGTEYQYWVRAVNSLGEGPFSAAVAGLRRLPFPGDLVWRSEALGDGSSAPAVGREGTIYFPGRDRRLYAYGPDFSLRWVYPSDGSTIGLLGNLSDPAVAEDGTVLLGAPDNYFYALTSDGSLRWRWRGYAGPWSRPTVDNGMVYVLQAGMNTLYAVRLADAVQAWKATPYIDGSECLVDVDGTVVAASANRYLAAFGPASAQRWLLSPSLNGAPWPLMFGPDATVYLAQAHRLVAATPEGSARWVSNYTSSFTTGLVMDRNGTLYSGGQNRSLLAFAADGRKLWEFTAGGEVQASPVLGEDGHIFFVASDRHLYALNPDGTKAWDVLLADLTVGSVRSALNFTPDGAILVASGTGPLLAVESGTRLADAPWPVHGGAPWRGGRRIPQLSFDPAQSQLEASHAEPVRVQALLRSPGRALARVELYNDYRATRAVQVATETPFTFVLTNLAVGVHTFALRAVDNGGLAYRSAPFTATVTSALRLAMGSPQGSPSLEFRSVPGKKHTVLRSLDLVTWETIVELTASASITRWPVGDLPSPPSQRFYRVGFAP